MAGELVIDASAVAAYGARLGAASGAVQAGLLGAMQRGTQLVRGQAQANAPKVTGALAASITAEATPTLGTVGTSIKYAQWVHNGRGPVRPVRAQVLHFFVHGQEVFTTYAGPAKANPFLYRALDQMRAQVEAEFAKAIADLIARIGA